MNNLLLTNATKLWTRHSSLSRLSPVISVRSLFPPRHQNMQPAIATTRCMATGTRGSRGHGWLKKYRSGLGGRHLQGRWHHRDLDELNAVNAQVFSLNESLGEEGSIPTEAYLDISVAGEAPRRVVIELASAALPRTTENFRLLCGEEEGKGGYASTLAYKIEKTVGMCFGDVVSNDGSGGRCHPKIGTYQSPFCFEDEAFLLSHTGPGIVTMVSPGAHRNDSRFLITTTDAPQLDGRFVAFGRVKDGMDVVNDIATGVFTKRGRPTAEIKVVESGVP